jgi:hypothetical protein
MPVTTWWIKLRDGNRSSGGKIKQQIIICVETRMQDV